MPGFGSRPSAERSRLIAVFVAMGFATGCRQNVDLGALRTMASDAREARPSYDALAADYRDSCLRTGELRSISIEAVSREAATGPAEDDRIASCAEATGIAEQWRRRDDVLTGYYIALGELAGDAPAAGSDRYGVRALASSLHESGVFAKPETDAFGELADGAIAENFDARRRDALAGYLERGAPLLKSMTAQLEQVARVNYRFELRRERDELARFRARNLRSARPGIDAFAAYQYARALREEDAELDAREAAADAYVASLEKLETASETIVAAIRRGDEPSALAAARLFDEDLHGDLPLLDRAFTTKGTRTP